MKNIFKLLGAIIALLWLSCVPAYAQFLGRGTNYTTTAQWSASAWSTTGSGAVLDSIFYSQTPLLTDTFTTAGCPEVGDWRFGTPNNGFKWYVTASTNATVGAKITFTGSIAGNVLTVTSPSGGTIVASQTVNFLVGSTATQDYILPYGTGGTTGTGGAGTYALNGSYTAASQTMTSQVTSYVPNHQSPLTGQTQPITCSSANHLQMQTFFSATAGGTGKPGWVKPAISSSDFNYYSGDGQAFGYGYFEATIVLPSVPVGLTPWNAWWMNGRLINPGVQPQYSELDFFETFITTNYTTTYHRWPATAPVPPGQIAAHQQVQTTTAVNLFDGLVHTYGILRNPNGATLWFDHKLVMSFPYFGDDMRGLMAMLLDGDLSATPTDPTQTFTMQVNSVSAYPCPPVGSGHELCR